MKTETNAKISQLMSNTNDRIKKIFLRANKTRLPRFLFHHCVQEIENHKTWDQKYRKLSTNILIACLVRVWTQVKTILTFN